MKAATVFFSWQSDSAPSANRNLIRRAIEQACQLQVDEPLRVDEAANDVSGTVDIPEAIFRKIRESAVAIFDVTIVGVTFDEGKSDAKRCKSLPNPNVLIELGYASSAIGWERVLTVFNTDGEHSPEDLPFDLRHRRFPIVYETGSSKSSAEKHLAWNLGERIKACLAAPHEQANFMRMRLDHDVLVALRRIALNESFHHGEGEISVETVRRMLDIGMIWCDQALKQSKYAYHFTYVGDLLRRQLYAESQ